jgi:hypothetical protein
MTPKQKAFELYFKFYRDIIADNDKSKQSALIAVDEVLDASLYSYDEMSIYVIYWQKVKQEIENL